MKLRLQRLAFPSTRPAVVPGEASRSKARLLQFFWQAVGFNRFPRADSAKPHRLGLAHKEGG